METQATTEEVAQQFERAILLLLQWAEEREISRKFNEAEPPEEKLEKRRLLRVDEVAEILAISKAHSYQLIRQGELECLRLGRSVRVRTDDLNSFLAKESE